MNWLPFALVTLESAHLNTTLDVDYVIVTNTADSTQHHELLRRFAEKTGKEIRHYFLDDSTLAQYSFGNSFLSALYRLKLPEILSENYDRVLYLDSDILVLESIDSLLQWNLEGHPIAAVEDAAVMLQLSKHAIEARKTNGFSDGQSYFNAGVMLMDWNKVIASAAFQHALSLLQTKNLVYADQDALNIEFKNRWCKLPPCYNVVSAVDDCITLEATIRHFTDRRKPWSEKFRSKDKRHRSYYSRALTALDGRPALPTLTPRIAARQASRSLKKFLKCYLQWNKEKRDAERSKKRQLESFFAERHAKK